MFDRTKGGIEIEGKEDDVCTRRVDVDKVDEEKNKISFHIFLDVSSVELFIDGGRYTMTGNVYPDDDDLGIEFFSDGKALIRNAEIFQLC